MERAHGELGARLANRLGGDNADGFTDFHRQASGEIQSVAIRTAATIRLAGENGADFEPLMADFFQRVCLGLGNDVIDFHDDITGDRVLDSFTRNPAVNPCGKGSNLLIAIIDRLHCDAIDGTAILLENDHILGHIHQLPSHVAGVRSFQRGIGKTFPGAVGGDEILKHRESLAEIRDDRALDNFTGRLGHQAAHPPELLDLGLVPPGTGIDHHEEWRRLFLAFVVLDLAIQRVGDGVGGLGPDIDDFLVALAVGDDTIAILLGDFFDLLVGFCDDFWLLLWDQHIDDADRDSGAHCLHEAERFQLIKNLDGLLLPSDLGAAPDDVTDLFFTDSLVVKTKLYGPDLVETDTPWGCLDHTQVTLTVWGNFPKILVPDADP